jgi:hypothetical protein
VALADVVPFAVAHWALDEASGARADSIGSNDLTDNNTVGSAAGMFSNGADFERDNSEYLSHASNATLQMGDIDFCIRFWFKLESLPASSFSLVTKDVDSPANSRDYTVDVHNDGGGNNLVRFYINGGGSSALIVISSVNLLTGTWYLVHAQHSATNNQLGLSVNGTTVTNTGTGGAVPETSSAEFRVGARPYSGFEDYFDGVIDDLVLIKGRNLIQDEVDEDYNGGAGVAFADWGADTFTASAALTFGAATCSASGEFDPPVYTGTAALTIGAAACSGSGLFAAEIYSGTAALAAPAASCSAAGEHTPPTYTGAAELTAPAATASGSGEHDPPTYTGTLAAVVGAAVCAASGSFETLTRTGTAALVAPAATCAGLGDGPGDLAVPKFPGGVTVHRAGISVRVSRAGITCTVERR